MDQVPLDYFKSPDRRLNNKYLKDKNVTLIDKIEVQSCTCSVPKINKVVTLCI